MGNLTRNTLGSDDDLNECGLWAIHKALADFGITGVFFVNVFESSCWPEELLSFITRKLAAAGHEIGLHCHPEWHFDGHRPHLWQYSLPEQTDVIREGLLLLNDWLPNGRIYAHRAGAYGMDANTLEALRTNDIPVDSSMFYGHPNCKVTWSRNRVMARDGILEIPVTGFYREHVIAVAGTVVRKRRSFIKTDIDWATLDELVFFVQEAKANDLRVMNLFMHSYSFVKFDHSSSDFAVDHDDIAKFRAFLDYCVADPNIHFVTMRDLLDIYETDPQALLDGSDYVPVVSKRTGLVEALKNRLRWSA